MASYATPTDLLDRKSAETIGDLVTDSSSTPPDATALLTDDKVQAALDSAAGAIEAALLVAGRYTVDQLAELAALSIENNPLNANDVRYNSRAHLVQMNCDIAMAYLFARKPTMMTDQYKAALELQDLYLERLRKGENVFNLQDPIEAGTPFSVTPTLAEIERLNLIRDTTRNYYPARRTQNAG